MLKHHHHSHHQLGHHHFQDLISRAVHAVTDCVCGGLSRIDGHPPVKGCSCVYEDLEARTLMSAVPATPIAESVQATGPAIVELNWAENNPAVTGYTVLRSTNGKTFTPIAKLTGGGAASFTDASALPDKTYTYKVEATGRNVKTAAVTFATVTTPPTAPVAGTPSLSNAGVAISWTAKDSTATGYVVYRTVGSATKTLATINSVGTTTYTDTTALSGQAYKYQVAAIKGAVLSALSGAMTVTTPLSAPSGLSVAAGDGGSVQLSWTNNDTNATSYTVQRSTDGSTYSAIGSVTGNSSHAYSDKGAATVTKYYYRVVAVTSAATSSASNVASMTTPLLTPGSVTAAATGPTSVKVTWADSDPGAQGYVVIRSAGDGGFSSVGTVTSGATKTFTDTSAAENTSYHYEVEAYNGGAVSAPATVASATTPLAAPGGFTATAVNHNSVVIGWTGTDTNAAGYYIMRTDGSTFSKIATVAGSTTNTYTDNTATGGHKYFYEVQAFAGTNTSATTAAVTVTTPLNAPTALTATTVGSTSTQLTWTGTDTAAGGYTVSRSTDGINFTPVGTTTTTAFADKTEATATTYYFKVTAFTAAATSAASNVVSLTTPLTTPTSLTAVAKSATSDQLNWTDADVHATGYLVLRSTGGGGFSQIATVSSGSTTTYTDATVSSGTAYQYEIESSSGSTNSAASNVASVTTPLVAPSALTATATGRNSVALAWTDNDANASGYNVFRSDGSTATVVATLAGQSTAAYTDTTVAAGHNYAYSVQAYAANAVSPGTVAATVTTPINAPTDLAAAASAGSVQLSWTDTDSVATGYEIFRSTGNGNFSLLTKVTGVTAHTFADNTVSPDAGYAYEVAAYDTVTASPFTSASTVSTPMAAPTSLVATPVGTNINLSWTDKDSTATGYTIMRSTDGTTFTQLATLTGPTTNVYVDATVASGTKYYYQVQATTTSASSAVSNTASATAVQGSTGNSVSIATRYTNELTITATGSSDTVTVAEDGAGNVNITADGQTFTQAVPADGIFVYTRGGSDGITIASSVTTPVTVETIDGAADDVTSSGSNVTAWIDSTDVFNGNGTVHRVSTFAGNVAKTTGASLANPSDAGATEKVTAPLFGSGPVANDADQGGSGDCYFLSSLAAFAGTRPGLLTQAVVDMGDGTYVVQWSPNGNAVYDRVSNSFSTGYYGGGLQFAHPGANGSIWAMVMEKAFCYERQGKNTYASISSGWMGEVYSDLGVGSTGFGLSGYNDTTLFNLLSNELSQGLAVTFGTSSSPPNLVGGHAYTLVSATRNAQGVAQYVVRNPWGVQGDSLENSQGYATLTFAQMESNFVDGCFANAA